MMRIGKHTRPHILAALALAMPAPGFAATTVPAEILTGGAWNVYYADDSCRLSREFGDGPQKIAVRMEWFEPNSQYELLLAGERFKSKDSHPPFKLSFGTAEPVERTVFAGQLSDQTPTLLTSGLRFDNRQGKTFAETKALPPVNAQSEDSARNLNIWFAKKKVTLQLGSMLAPMNAVRTCLDTLVTHWGIDADAQKTLTQPVEPIGNPGSWISDYPQSALNKGQQAVVHIRVSVGMDGQPTDCSIQRASGEPTFSEIACRGLMRRARFKPALDKNGNPIASYYVTNVRWILN